MTSETYNALTKVLLNSALIALLVSSCFLIAAIIGWRGPQRKKRLIRCVACAAAFPVLLATQQALLYWVFLPSLGREHQRLVAERLAASSLIKVDDAVPAFHVTDTDGIDVQVNNVPGKVVLLNFFTTECGPCIREMPHLETIWNTYGKRDDFSLVVIGAEESHAAVTAFKAKYGCTFAFAADPDGSLFALFATGTFPRTYLVAPDGRICFASCGIEDPTLDKLNIELSKQLATAQKP